MENEVVQVLDPDQEQQGQWQGQSGWHRPTLALTSQQKNLIAQFLLQRSSAGVLPRGSCAEAANKFNIHKRTAERIWHISKQQMDRGEPVMMQGKVKGYQHKDKLMLDEDKFRNLSMLERSTIRKVASKMEVSKTTIGRFLKRNQLKPHTSAIKPTLTETNKIARIKWCLSHIQPTLAEGKLLYHSMHNIVHIDEKWFYMTKTSDRYYLLPDEDVPYRSCKSKRFITKVMFMAAVSRPLCGPDGDIIFDGKIGLFPFTEQIPAQRSSKNRPKGTMETKPIQSITKEVMTACLINQIIPSIKAKWPANASKKIFIQQDNAKPHLRAADHQFEALASTDGFEFHLISQPPNSPDTNVLDLGYFRAIQSLQDDKMATSVDDLLRNVFNSFEELSPQTLNRVFITLQSCLTAILQVHGKNDYKIPHMNKNRLERTEGLPLQFHVEEGLVRESLEYLKLPENNTGDSYDIGRLNHALGY
ncbi:uncharacterized protein LOC121779679 [Salvia splendens]|uniref:uncharacterized protein LOC121779679 n=1 Tax=Salvia splendens TaxID=180675 RepID=UPI001C27407C|nr:uncharacterized protein LOC121779679 [Salvia splendens]